MRSVAGQARMEAQREYRPGEVHLPLYELHSGVQQGGDQRRAAAVLRLRLKVDLPLPALFPVLQPPQSALAIPTNEQVVAWARWCLHRALPW